MRADEKVIRTRAYAWWLAVAAFAVLAHFQAQAQGRPDPGEIRGEAGLNANR